MSVDFKTVSLRLPTDWIKVIDERSRGLAMSPYIRHFIIGPWIDGRSSPELLGGDGSSAPVASEMQMDDGATPPSTPLPSLIGQRVAKTWLWPPEEEELTDLCVFAAKNADMEEEWPSKWERMEYLQGFPDDCPSDRLASWKMRYGKQGE